MRKKKTQKQIREEQQQAALRQRLIDMASGAGVDDPECADYWAHDVHSLERLIRSVDRAFREQVVAKGCSDTVLTKYFQLPRYESLDELQEWLWGMGVRA